MVPCLQMRETRSEFLNGTMDLGLWGKSVSVATTAAGTAFGLACPPPPHQAKDLHVPVGPVVVGVGAANMAVLAFILFPLQVTGVAVGASVVYGCRYADALIEAKYKNNT